jgi:hypothetical protein
LTVILENKPPFFASNFYFNSSISQIDHSMSSTTSIRTIGSPIEEKMPKVVEPIQYASEFYTEANYKETTDSTAGEDEDARASKRLRTNSFSENMNGVFRMANAAQKPISEPTAKGKTAGVADTGDGSVYQEVQTTNLSHGSRIPRLLLTTLLPLSLTKNIIVSELPPELDSDHMNASYKMVSVPVPDKLCFRARFASLLRHFVENRPCPQLKTETTVFMLFSVKNCSCKMITLAEKIKQDLEVRQIRCFQYCALQSRTILVERAQTNRKEEKVSQDANADTVISSGAKGLDGHERNNEDEEEAFQTMDVSKGHSKEVVSDGPKLRRLPVMTIFLAMAPVPELRQLYELAPLFIYLHLRLFH